MKNILGLHFGHNSHAILLSGKTIKSYIQRERLTGIKNQAGVNKELIQKCLSDAEISINEIDQVAITNTQEREFIFEDNDYFNFKYESNGCSSICDNFFDKNKDKLISFNEINENFINKNSKRILKAHKEQYPHLIPYIDSKNKKLNLPFESYLIHDRSSLKDIFFAFTNKDKDKFEKSRIFNISRLLIPLKVYLGGRSLPGFQVDHHLAHTYSAGLKSDYKECLIFTADGSGAGPLGNLVSIKTKEGIFPITCTSFRGGQFYEECASFVGLDCGKFMGLAAYGNINPIFMEKIIKQAGEDIIKLNANNFKGFFEHFFSTFINNNNLLSSDTVNFAAHVQQVFEIQYLKTVLKYFDTSQKFLDTLFDGVILSGGCALNCPANSYLVNILGEKKLYVEPSCNDEGLGFGASMVIESLINNENIDNLCSNTNLYASPFHGPKARRLTNYSINQYSKYLKFEKIDEANWGIKVANRLLNNDIGMLIRGKSEIGPRALGNRSIIAIPDQYSVSEKVNLIKRREAWRPLAPACLEKHFNYFFNGPRNPYMLMTCKAKNLYFPGVVHVDGSARVQNVTSESHNFYLILKSLDEIINRPMLILNTSCNRRNEGIINDENTAIRFLMDSELDFLVTDNYLITKF